MGIRPFSELGWISHFARHFRNYTGLHSRNGGHAVRIGPVFPATMTTDQRLEVQNFVDEVSKKHNSKVITAEKYANIVEYLKTKETHHSVVEKAASKFKWWVREKKFALVNFPELELHEVLCVPSKKENTNDLTLLGKWRRVAHTGNICDILDRVHCLQSGHLGLKKTLHQIGLNYEGIPRSIVSKFVSTCSTCQPATSASHVFRPCFSRSPAVLSSHSKFDQARGHQSSTLTAMADFGKALLVVDVDTGVDDAQALMLALASPRVKVLGVTCVNGNVAVDRVCTNTLRVLQVCQETQVTCSCLLWVITALVEEGSQYWDDGDALGDVEWSGSVDRSLLHTEPAASALVRLASQHPGEITLVALAPMTNLAVAMRLDPDFTSKLKALYIMGGNIEGRGNIRPGCEFNFAVDPEAAFALLIGAQCPVHQLPWEPCNKMLLSWEFYDKWTKGKTEKADFLKRITATTAQRMQMKKRGGFRSCDLYAMAACVVPECVVETQAVHATVELQGQLTRGQMVVDWAGHFGRPCNVNLITKLDLTVLEEHLMAMVSL